MSNLDYAAEWAKKFSEALQVHGYEIGANLSRQVQQEAVLKALPGYLLLCFCEEQRGLRGTRWEPLDGVKPAQLFVIQKHHWLPDQAFSLTHEQLQLVLHDELRALALTSRAYRVVQSDIEHLGLTGMKLTQKPDSAERT